MDLDGVAMNFPHPNKTNFSEAVSLSRTLLEDTEFTFAGFALLMTESYSQWSLSLTTSKYLYEPRFCVTVGLDIVNIFKSKNINNIEIVNTELMYTELPVSSQSLDRFQIKFKVLKLNQIQLPYLPGEREVILSKKNAPPTIFKKRAKTAPSTIIQDQQPGTSNISGVTSTEKDHCSGEVDPGVYYAESISVNDNDDNVSVVSTTPAFAKGINFQDFKASKFNDDYSFESEAKGLNDKTEYYRNFYITIENVKSINKSELLAYASRKKINLYFTLIRKQERLERLTRREKIFRSSKKLVDRLLSFVLSGQIRPWNPEYSDNLDINFKDAVFEHIVEEFPQQLNLSLLRAVTILAHDNNALKLNITKFKNLKQLSYNYLINSKIKLKTDIGCLTYSQFQRLLEEYLSVPHNYCLYARELDSRIGYGRRQHPFDAEVTNRISI